MGGVIPEDIVQRLAEQHGIRRAVETGTFLGHGTTVLARHFDRVETIELSRYLAFRATMLFLLNRRVRVRRGSSANLLRPSADPTLYWLDGHWSGKGTVGEEHQCPLLDELRLLAPGNPRNCYLIDDARLFLEPAPPPLDPDQWPTFEEIERFVGEHLPTHAVTLDGDVIVVAPS